MRLSEKIGNIEESGTVKFTPIIDRLRKQGKEIIDFAVGEPDLMPPEEVINATKHALEENNTRYATVSGIMELKRVISEKLRKDNRIKCSEDNILISTGSKQCLYNVFQAICNPGDEVIIPKPYWVTFPEQVKLADAKPVFVKTVANQLDIEEIKNAISKKTKAIVVNSPNNPSGAVFKKEDLKAVGDIAVDNDLFIVSDEAYEMFVYDDLKHFSIASINEEVRKHVITVNSFSKTFSMTGFRVGYVAAEKEIISSMNKLQSHVTGNTCTFAQYGAIAALEMNKDLIEKRIKIFEKRRNLAYKLTNKLFECINPEGAFYLFPNVKDALGNDFKTSEELASHFLEKIGVATVPGEAFGVSNHIRISYALPEDEIKRGFEMMEKIL